MAVRATKGLSQKDIADHMGVTQSKISKLEGGDDAALNLEDFRGYLSAVDLDLRMIICPKEWPLIDQIKFFALTIKSKLNLLVERARTTEAVQNAENHHIELLYNMVNIVATSASNLPDLTVDTPDIMNAEDHDGVDDQMNLGCREQCTA